jgi:hypothetical protein
MGAFWQQQESADGCEPGQAASSISGDVSNGTEGGRIEKIHSPYDRPAACSTGSRATQDSNQSLGAMRLMDRGTSESSSSSTLSGEVGLSCNFGVASLLYHAGRKWGGLPPISCWSY